MLAQLWVQGEHRLGKLQKFHDYISLMIFEREWSEMEHARMMKSKYDLQVYL
jgi:hypothetical protein